MRIDTGQTAFDMQQIENRRFMYQPQTGTLILGYQYKGNHLASSHADEHFKSGAAEPFDSFIRGWIGSGKSYPHGIIHFAPNIRQTTYRPLTGLIPPCRCSVITAQPAIP